MYLFVWPGICSRLQYYIGIYIWPRRMAYIHMCDVDVLTKAETLSNSSSKSIRLHKPYISIRSRYIIAATLESFASYPSAKGCLVHVRALRKRPSQNGMRLGWRLPVHLKSMLCYSTINSCGLTVLSRLVVWRLVLEALHQSFASSDFSKRSKLSGLEVKGINFAQ